MKGGKEERTRRTEEEGRELVVGRETGVDSCGRTTRWPLPTRISSLSTVREGGGYQEE